MPSHAMKTSLWTALLLSSAMAQRTTISLCGTWDVQDVAGTSTTMPTTFTHTIPVPSYTDMATPPMPASVYVYGWIGGFWYRKTFTIQGAVPAVARLKIFKAKYGTDVWLNGTYIGAHAPCFTPGYFNLIPALVGNGAQNTLVVRVGTYWSTIAGPDTVVDGHDGEKLGVLSGIYDSVQVILSGSPCITKLKTAPDLTGAKVRVFASLDKAGSSTTVPIRAYVYEVSTGTLAGSAQISSMTVPASRETTAVLDISLPGFKPWSPESPFLYHLAVSTGTDSADARFGMRTIGTGLTPLGNKMILNGQPYMLLGTNVCFHRFENDSLRGGLVFDDNWVRTVYRKFKSVNWNSARFSLGLAPEQWYRIADEEGFLIEDEYAIWGLSTTVTQSDLNTEFTEWTNERVNHPSVFLWDALNETNSTVADSAGHAMIVQGLDPQNRPWNFGFDHPSYEGIAEDHPYDQGGGVASNITKVNWNFTASKKPPLIYNEYDWLWLTRAGSLTYSTASVFLPSYDGAFVNYPTVDSRRLYRYRMTAAATERFRMGYDVAGVMDFTGLTVNREVSSSSLHTTDHWLPDITNPQFSNELLAYAPDAFSPLMVGINTGFAVRAPGSSDTIEVVLVNDSYQSWTGPVHFRVQDSVSILSEQIKTATVAALSKTSVTFNITYSTKSPQICRLQALIAWNGKRLRSVRDFPIGTSSQPVLPGEICSTCDTLGGTTGTVPQTVSPASKVFELVAASPNPFAQTTQIKFIVPFDSKVCIEVCDISGRVVKTLVNGPARAGYHTVLLDGFADSNRALANGYYFCRMTAKGFEKTVKLVKVK